MKMKLDIVIFVFLIGMILGTTQPASVYAGETPGGNLWDPFVNVSFFTLQTVSYSRVQILPARLNITYSTFFGVCGNGNYMATMFYSVSSPDSSKWPWVHTSFTPGICLGDIGTPGSGGQGDVILGFLKNVVLQMSPFAKDAYLQSVNNPVITADAFGFTADIIIAVRLW